MSYGDLSNSHFLQKYGFTLQDNPNNKTVVRTHMREYEKYLFDETALKQEISQKLNIQISSHLSYELYMNRFDQSILQRLRLIFLTSKSMI